MGEVEALEYASPKRRRRAWPWAMAAFLVAVVAIPAFAGPRWASVTQWLSDLSDRRAVLAGAAATGTLDLTLPAEVGSNPALPNALFQRIGAWTGGNRATQVKLENLLRPRPGNYPGDPGAMFIGRVRAEDGQERIIAIGANVALVPQRSMLLLRFDAELFGIGAPRSPAFVPLRASADPRLREFTPGVYESFRWLGVDVRFTPGDDIRLGGPVVRPDDPATVRFPITVQGESDELLFTLKPGARIDVRRASGKHGRFDAQPATTRSAT